MGKENIRLRNFLMELDQLIMDNEYYDDEKETEVCDITEEQCYEILMKNDEWHLLGTEKVKGLISLFITDFKSRMAILRAYDAL